MHKTTIYLPDGLKRAVEREARLRGVPEAEIIRKAIAASVQSPAPNIGLFASDELLASRVDELLEGFGDR